MCFLLINNAKWLSLEIEEAGLLLALFTSTGGIVYFEPTTRTQPNPTQPPKKK
jgi:hypothetical protein